MDNWLHSFVHFLLPTNAVLSPAQHDIVVEAIYEIAPTFLFTVLLVVLCELASYRTVLALRQTKEGAAQHTDGFLMTIINLFLVGIPVHVAARLIVPAREDAPRSSVAEVLVRITAFVVLQNILFYLAHMAMHTPSLYWMHRYHHRYNTYVTPSAANAVTVAEFLFAYIIPPAVVLILIQPSKMEYTIAMNIIAQCSTLVHTPGMETWCARYLPAWWVGTDDHCEHHRRLTKNYASPCLNLDYILFGHHHQQQKKKDVAKNH